MKSQSLPWVDGQKNFHLYDGNWGALGCASLILMSSVVFFIIGLGSYVQMLRESPQYGGSDGGGGSTSYPVGIDSQAISPKINDYIKKKVPTSPLVNSGLSFAQAGQKWNINPALMMAIAYHESKFGTAGKRGPAANNPFGWGCPPCQRFNSWEKGIEHVTEKMRKNYINQGFNTIEKIQKKYCPVGASNDPDGLNQFWLDGVKGSFNDILNDIPELRTAFLVESGSIIAIAKQEVGVKEQRNCVNCGASEKYGAGRGNPWCAAFVSWVYTKDSKPIKIFAVDAMWKFFTQSHRILPKNITPSPGDVIFFTYDHVGIVENVAGGELILSPAITEMRLKETK